MMKIIINKNNDDDDVVDDDDGNDKSIKEVLGWIVTLQRKQWPALIQSTEVNNSRPYYTSNSNSNRNNNTTTNNSWYLYNAF